MTGVVLEDGYALWRSPAATTDVGRVFALHGTGGDSASFGALAKQLAPGRAVVAPQGDVSEFGAPRFFRRRAEGVYDMADLERAIEKFDRFLDVEGADDAVGVGFSNGANLLAAHAFARPGRLKRLVLLRPLIPYVPPEADLSGLSVTIAAGRMDPIAPVEASEALAAAFAGRGAKVDLRWADAGHGLLAVEQPIIEAALA